MHSMVLWPCLAMLAAAVTLVPTLEGSSQRAIVYWLIIPLLLTGIVAAWAEFRVL